MFMMFCFVVTRRGATRCCPKFSPLLVSRFVMSVSEGFSTSCLIFMSASRICTSGGPMSLFPSPNSTMNLSSMGLVWPIPAVPYPMP